MIINPDDFSTIIHAVQVKVLNLIADIIIWIQAAGFEVMHLVEHIRKTTKCPHEYPQLKLCLLNQTFYVNLCEEVV